MQRTKGNLLEAALESVDSREWKVFGGMSRAECGRQEADRNWWGGAGGQEQVEAVLGRVSSP